MIELPERDPGQKIIAAVVAFIYLLSLTVTYLEMNGAI